MPSVRLGGILIVGPMSRSSVATLADQHSRHLRLVHVPEGHRAEQLVHALARIPAAKRLTLT